jgi:hypothetical protein
MPVRARAGRVRASAHAYVGLTVTEIATLRAELGGALQG